MFAKLLPRETTFFDFFERHASITEQAVSEFLRMCDHGANHVSLAKRIKELEHEADVTTHRCVEELHKTFITPFDRYDIHRLITRMDDILDHVEAVSERTVLYELGDMRPEARMLGEILRKSVQQVEIAVHALRDMKNASAIMQACVDINRLENEADTVLRSAIARLFREETNTMDVIKWKEIFENLETATDRCEDVAQVLEGVVLEHA